MKIHVSTGLVVFIVALLSLGASNAYATETEKKKVYKVIGADGSVTYSDKPIKGGVEIDVPLGSTYAPVTRPTQQVNQPRIESKQTKSITYQGFSIQTPVDNETIRDNSGNVSFSVVFTPGLAEGHEIQFLIGEKIVGSGTSSTLSLTNLDRGTHRLTVRIMDKTGEIVVAQSIHFHLKRHFVRQQ